MKTHTKLVSAMLFFLFLLTIIVLAIAPSILLTSPLNASISDQGYGAFSMTLFDADNDSLSIRIFGSNNSNLSNNDSLIYEQANILDGTTLTFNWTVSAIQSAPETRALYHFNNQSQFAENSTTAYDFSGYGNNATCSGSTCPTWNRTGGKLAGAFEFDGINDSFSIRDNAFAALAEGTIEAWINPRVADNGTIFAVKENPADARDFFIFYLDSGRLTAGINKAGKYQWLGTGDTTINNNTWAHVAVKINASGNYMYVNGVQQTVTYTNGDSAKTQFIAGLGGTKTNYLGKLVLNNVDTVLFNGTIDELAIHNISLDDGVILDHARMNPNDKTYYWKALIGDGSNENSTNRYNFLLGSLWNRTPSDFGARSGNVSKNITLGNLFISNKELRNFNLTFNISSNYENTYYNVSWPFNLSPGENKLIEVNFSAPPTTGTTNVVLNITAINAETLEPVTSASLLTTAEAIYTAGEPFLDVVINFPNEEDDYTTGKSDLNITATVTNIGSGYATDVYLWFELPSFWFNNTGLLNNSVGNLTVTQNVTRSILVTIPPTAETGTQIIRVNASGKNESSASLNESLISGASINAFILDPVTPRPPGIEIIAPSTVLGTGSTISAGGSGGGRLLIGETLYTNKTLEVVRGSKEKVITIIKNLYENTYLKNVSLSVQGYKSQYVKVTQVTNLSKIVYLETKNAVLVENQPLSLNFTGTSNYDLEFKKTLGQTATIAINSELMTLQNGETKILDFVAITLVNITSERVINLRTHKIGELEPSKIRFLEEREYGLEIFAPAYLQADNFTVILEITAEIVANDPENSEFSSKPLKEYRSITIKIFEISTEEAKQNLDEAKSYFEDMKNLGFPLTQIEKLILEAELALKEENYEKVLGITEQIRKRKNSAIAADAIIKEVIESINKANNRWLETPQSSEALTLALKAFEREDFETAFKRAQSAKLALIIETNGKLDLGWLLKTYWWLMLISLFLISIIAFVSYKKLSVLIISQRIKNLDTEEKTIRSLMEESQIKHIQEGSLSESDYNKGMTHYRSRINKINQIRSKLKNKKISLLKKQQGIINIRKEENDLIKAMEENQNKYLKEGKITRKSFLETEESNKIRLAELEGEKEVLKEKISNSKKTKSSRAIHAIPQIIKNILEKRKRIYNPSQKLKIIKPGNKSPNLKKLKQKLFKNSENLVVPENDSLKEKANNSKTNKKEKPLKKVKKRFLPIKKIEKKKYKWDGLSQKSESKKKRKEVKELLKKHGIKFEESKND